jgi:hypothetical protein
VEDHKLAKRTQKGSRHLELGAWHFPGYKGATPQAVHKDLQIEHSQQHAVNSSFAWHAHSARFSLSARTTSMQVGGSVAVAGPPLSAWWLAAGFKRCTWSWYTGGGLLPTSKGLACRFSNALVAWLASLHTQLAAIGRVMT